MSNLPPPPQGGPPWPPPLHYASVPLNYAPPARNDLRQIAIQQKVIIYCILGYIVFGMLQFVLPQELKLIGLLAIAAVGITATVFVFMLAISIHNTGLGIVLGLLALIPCVGLIVLLVVNGQATSLLRAHGIRVGLMGANTKQIPQAGIIDR
jgi:hypothetical protein